jgi:predicted dienelactone hydrolase
VAAGGRAKFFVKASGPTPLNFQWQSNGVAIAGATNRTLVFSNAQPTHAADYAVLVSAPAIGASMLSDAATLTVTSSPPVRVHGFEGIQIGPPGTVRMSLSGTAPAMVRAYYDIHPIDTSTMLSNWTAFAALVRTNSSPTPLELFDTDAANFAQRFFRTPTNHFITPLPKPTGPFPVATLSRFLGGRLVTFWYPTESKAGALPVKYIEDSFITQRAAYRDYTAQVRSFRAFSISNTVVATNQVSYPVLIYSHAGGGHRRENIDKAEDLASHGYVVLSTDHADSSGDNPQLVVMRAADARFLLDQLVSLNASDPMFGGRLDLAKTGAFGWSLGGAAAAELCRVDARCKAGVNMDGSFFNPALAQSGLNQPFMIMNNNVFDFAFDFVSDFNFSEPNDDVKRVFDRLTQNAYRLKITGTSHQNFGEAELIITADAFSRRAAQVIRAYLLSFFNKHLKGQDDHLLDGLSADYPEVTEFLKK